MEPDGLWYQPSAAPGKEPPSPYKICSPFGIIGRVASKFATECGLAITFSHVGVIHEVIIPNTLLHIDGGNKLCLFLADKGMQIETGPSRALMQHCINNVYASRTLRSVKTTGWHQAVNGISSCCRTKPTSAAIRT